MSRISRYQESIEKFIKNKNINNYFADEFVNNINNKLNNSDHLCGIILSTIFNHNTKKSNIKGHGYFLGIVIDICLIILDLDKTDTDLHINLLTGLYKLLNENIQILKTNAIDKINNISNKSYDYFNLHIYDILSSTKMQTKKMVKSDLLNLSSITNEMYKKISGMNRYVTDEFTEYVKKKYGTLGKLIVVLSWIMGGGSYDKKTITNLESIGEKFGMMYKICVDFENVIKDINNTNQNVIKNTVFNFGVQESFALFMELKSSFYEESFKLEIYTHTMKEVLDELELKMDKCIENCKIDMKSTYSSFSK